MKEMNNLERLKFNHSIEFDSLLPFFHYSNKLTTVWLLKFNGENLNLSALNEERKQIGVTRKVFIYVQESVYLKAKWATENLNLNLVEIARLESIDTSLWWSFEILP